MDADAPPQASTSRVKLDTPQVAVAEEIVLTEPSIAPQPELDVMPVEESEPTAAPAEPVPLSKRAKHRAHLRAKVEKRTSHFAPDTHEVKLRSGKHLQIPDRLQPEAFARKIRLDKRKAQNNRPKICESLVIGLNAVTRYLEDTLEAGRTEVTGQPHASVTRLDSKTASRHLRLHIPTPTNGTRRDRRALKERIRSSSGLSKQKPSRSETTPSIPRLPPYFEIPRNEPILKYTLQDMQDRLESKALDSGDIWAFLGNIKEMMAYIEDDKLSQDLPPAKEKESNIEPTLKQENWQIPSELVDAILFSAGQVITEDEIRERSMLLALFMRYNPEWFQVWRQRNEALKRLRISREWETPKIQKPTVIPSAIQPQPTEIKPLRLVFVAKADINPIHLVQHLLTSVSANNSLNVARRKLLESSKKGEDGSEDVEKYEDIYLVPLPRGAEGRLAALLALRRVSVLAFTVGSMPYIQAKNVADSQQQNNESSEFQKLLTLVRSHLPEPLKADWLVPAINHPSQLQSQQGNFIPAHVKLMQTTAPTDIKALRAQRQAEKKRKRDAAREHSAARGTAKKSRTDASEQSTSNSKSISASLAAPRESTGAEILISTQPVSA